MSDISIGHVEPEGVKARPGLLHEIEKSSGAAPDVEEPQLALIATGKKFVELRQRLASHRIGRSVEQHFNLGVISLGGIIRHPAARLKVEILKIVAWPLGARVGVENFAICAGLATAMDLGKIRKEQP